MRYLDHDVAKHFGSSQKTEIIDLSDDAVYEHLLALLQKKYDAAIKQLYSERIKEKMLDTFVFICEGKPLRTIKNKMINPRKEVLVAYADFGG
jgi:hypothetical protein